MKSIASLLSAAALGAAALLVPGVAHAAAPNYVAMGDSYASGVGTRTYISSSGSCQRSTKAYAYLDAARIGANLNFVACSGAKVADVTANQLPSVTSSTNIVSVQVGGNDAGFSSVITTCAEPSWLGDCTSAVAGAQSIINNTLPGRLNTLYAAIKSRASSAKVVVVGYPRLFNGIDCNAATFFSPTEMTHLNATADLLNSKLAAAASAAGFTFVNPTSAFIGHAVCGSPEWINGLSNPVSESYHPNVTGQANYANLVQPAL
ncbi:SGNH/GDSL hydrolase family protein [Kribbella sp.]|uniref:SGNH/GDSL hydrolase family protein n=1 Tax=Kribbella sp. TaxID=1871183 RepID=UPI002D26A00D|nr:SGNH/GDSL hydrolase family protein [Kribbella sp.]HZX08301.1 SGNH/GDSL hydrolase family protein [Kribbella sp.]